MFASLLESIRYELFEGLHKSMGKGDEKEKAAKSRHPAKDDDDDDDGKEQRAKERHQFNRKVADRKEAKAAKTHRMNMGFKAQKRHKAMKQALGKIASATKAAVKK